MYKVTRDTLRKPTKHLMVISTIATLLIAAMGITTTTNASAFNFGLLSKDDNLGSIDTDSLFSCVGAAINCVNENEENNNVIANNNEETPIPPPPPSVPSTCEECFTFNLTPEEMILLEDLSGNTIGEVCLEFASLPSLPPELAAEELAELEQGLVDLVGVDPIRAQAVIDCLEVVFGL